MSSIVSEATCTAPVNIAVVKYWGKRSTQLILPTNSSLSVTLDQTDLRSLTSAGAVLNSSNDKLWLNGKEELISLGGRTETCLRELRALRAKIEQNDSSQPKLSSLALHIASANNFPTAAGLASSASGLSALIFTIATLYQLEQHGISTAQLSRIARQGSGSACRSMFGGFVAWEMGSAEDGSDSVAVQVASESDWSEMHGLILVVSDKKKTTSSTAGMQNTVATSALLQHRINSVVPARMEIMAKAIRERDFDTFARETMADSNQFHAVCLDTTPPIFYLNDVSRAIIAVVEEINRVSLANEGRYKAAYTFDAGPNAVIYALDKDIADILNVVNTFFPQPDTDTAALSSLPLGFNPAIVARQDSNAVSRIIKTKVGDGPRILGQDQSLLNQNAIPHSLS